jgi:hypothetical protein
MNTWPNTTTLSEKARSVSITLSREGSVPSASCLDGSGDGSGRTDVTVSGYSSASRVGRPGKPIHSRPGVFDCCLELRAWPASII